jgi:hypothetical protein
MQFNTPHSNTPVAILSKKKMFPLRYLEVDMGIKGPLNTIHAARCMTVVIVLVAISPFLSSSSRDLGLAGEKILLAMPFLRRVLI